MENVVQAIARDCLAVDIMRVQEKGYNIVMHVHDEMIVEVPENDAENAFRRISDSMGTPIPWAPDLPLRGDGYITKHYKKD